MVFLHFINVTIQTFDWYKCKSYTIYLLKVLFFNKKFMLI